MAFYDPAMLQVRVLLVDQDVIKLHETCTLLQFNSYKVTMVEDVSAASSLLMSRGKSAFDVVMIDISLPNVQGFQLMRQAITMDLLVILISSDESANLVKGAIEDGAFMLMQKPVAAADFKYVWQHVFREKKRREAKHDQRLMVDDQQLHLHGEFVDPVMQLEMNVPGLTRLKVANHLQKCRRSKPRTPSRLQRSRATPRKYGALPKDLTMSPSPLPPLVGTPGQGISTAANNKINGEASAGGIVMDQSLDQFDALLESLSKDDDIDNTINLNNFNFNDLERSWPYYL